MTSTFLLISVSTWLICWLTSLVPSTASRVTSEYCPAWLLALVVMAPIQPWSACGAEKPMVTCLPGGRCRRRTRPGGVARLAGVVPLLLLVQAVSSGAGAERAAAPSSEPAATGMADGPVMRADTCAVLRHVGAAAAGGLRCGCGAAGQVAARAPSARRWSSTAATMITPLAMFWTSVARLLRMKMLVIVVKTSTPRIEPIERAAAAGEQGAADDHGGDGVELVEVAVGARPGRRCGR